MKRFSKAAITIVVVLVLIVAFLLFFYHQNGYLFNPNRSVENNQKNSVDTSQSVQKEGLVLASSDYVLQQTEKPDLLIVGKAYKTKYTSLSTLIAGTSRPVMDFISSNKLIMKGSIISVYNQVPNENQDMEIFVGIPVNKKIITSEFEFREIKGGKFHKSTINSEIGKAASIWTKVCDDLVKSGQKITFPIFEYPSDSRNSEMTTVISQSNLLIPVTK